MRLSPRAAATTERSRSGGVRGSVAAMPAAHRRILIVFAVAVAVSIVHYIDNVSAYHEYPRSGTLPNPSQLVIAGSWLFFTCAGLYGVRQLRARRIKEAAIGFAVYSGSGLVGILHYTVGGTSSFPWWRHAHICADILLGVAIFASAMQLALSTRRQPTVTA